MATSAAQPVNPKITDGSEAQLLAAIRNLQSGRFETAAEMGRRILQDDPGCAPACHLLGVAAFHRGSMDRAIEYFRQALERSPDEARYHFSLGQAQHRLGRLTDAARTYERALDLGLATAEVYNNLGFVRGALGQLTPAAAALAEAIRLDPNMAAPVHNLAAILRRQWRLDAALRQYRRAVDLAPEDHKSHTNLLFALNYCTRYSKKTIAAEHRRWADRHARSLPGSKSRFQTRDRNPHRRIRLGYVSGDLRFHPVAFFLEPLLAGHDHEQFHVTVYSTMGPSDAVTGRLQRDADRWREVAGINDDDLLERILADRIDVLVDLNGHTAGNRLQVFARRAAPIQATYLGYPNTTGMGAMDVRFTDALADPPEATEHLYTETLVRLASGFCCYRPPDPAPAVNDLPALQNGHLTFGCFNDPLRINPPLIAIWSLILKSLPDSHLHLQTRPGSDRVAAQRLLQTFTVHGIDRRRIHLQGYMPFDEHLRLYRKVDIALDTFPFNGHTNTCHAMWMGVPVITLAGENYISRMGASLLTRIGLPELVAADPQTYVLNVVRLARDLDSLARLRACLRPLMGQSVLTDRRHFCRELERQVRCLWQRWCR